VTVVILPGAVRCSHRDPETGARCITLLERRNAGPTCHTHTPSRSRRVDTDRTMRALPTPSAEAVAGALESLGVKVAA
jgi:hypothetical protein